jgi:hypothetical protein
MRFGRLAHVAWRPILQFVPMLTFISRGWLILALNLQCIFPLERRITTDVRNWCQSVEERVIRMENDMRRWCQAIEEQFARMGVASGLSTVLSQPVPPTLMGSSTDTVLGSDIFHQLLPYESENEDLGQAFYRMLNPVVQRMIDQQTEKRVEQELRRRALSSNPAFVESSFFCNGHSHPLSSPTAVAKHAYPNAGGAGASFSTFSVVLSTFRQ